MKSMTARLFLKLICICIASTLSIKVFAQSQFLSITPDPVTPNNLIVHWQADPQATLLYLFLGSYPDGADLGGYDITNQPGSISVPVPANVDPVHLMIYTYTPTSFFTTKTTYSPSLGGSPVSIISPTDGSTLTDKLTTLNWDWTGSSNNGFFQVTIGSAPGVGDIASYFLAPGERFAPMNIALDGSPVHVTVATTTGSSDGDTGITHHLTSAAYSSATSGTDSGTQPTSPPVGSTLTDINVAFQWAADSSASSFEVSIGFSPDAGSYYAMETINHPSITQATLPVVLDGNPSYLTIKTIWANGASYTRTYEYQTILPPDTDGDGVHDLLDQCPNTPPGAEVEADGCVPDQDSDGVSDFLDLCPNTEPGATVDSNGCSPAQLDTDGDGVPDVNDQCPNTTPEQYGEVDADGCHPDQKDADGDGLADYLDPYPLQYSTMCPAH